MKKNDPELALDFHALDIVSFELTVELVLETCRNRTKTKSHVRFVYFNLNGIVIQRKELVYGKQHD